jgi:hypothetical protein
LRDRDADEQERGQGSAERDQSPALGMPDASERGAARRIEGLEAVSEFRIGGRMGRQSVLKILQGRAGGQSVRTCLPGEGTDNLRRFLPRRF